MSQSLLKRIEEFRKRQNLPILTLCKMMDVHNVTYHRWRNAGKITGAYNKIIEDFLEKNDKSLLHKTSDIAVIGIACYYPGASNVHELWENILARRVQFRRMLDQRLPLSEYYSEDSKSSDKTYLTKASFIENFQFDWGKLRIPKKTVESTDIAHWLALDIALKTFEDAGYKLNEIPLQNTGAIVGNTLTGEQTRSQTLRLRWPYVQKALNATLGHLGKSMEERSQTASEMEKIYKSAFYPVTEDSLAGGLANTIAGRICNYLNLKGGGYIVDGACSSSLLAVATAADALKMGHMDLALAGGVDISLDPFELVGFAKAGALARDQMRVYDQKANGFLPGEGCGFILLKRLKDAIRDKNYVYAVIKGWGISSDGRGGIMEPSSSGQSFAIGRAYKDLEYKISDVDFVEGHGTGTTKGDRVELEGIAASIAKTVKKRDINKRACGVTSFKSIVGHTKAAAGVGGLIKAILAVNQRVLPPTANCTHPNEVFKDKAKHLYPIIQGGQLSESQVVKAGISSAGFGGINCHVTIESKDAPSKKLKPQLDEGALFVSQQETEVFVFTSRTVIHLEKIIQKFKEDLRNISIAEMADLAALLNKKVKYGLPIKAAIVTDSPEHLYAALVLIEKEIQNVPLEEGKVHKIRSADALTRIILSNGVKKCRIGFLYPGQGSQRLNMARTIVERYKWARDLFKLSQLPLFEKIYVPVHKFIAKEEQQEFDKQLSNTRVTQPAVVLSSLIWTEFMSRLGVEAQCAVGHSLGELTAFYKGGAFNKETLLKFAQFRGELMASDSRLSGSMVSLFCSKDKASALIEKVSGNIVMANINSPSQIVLSGGKSEVKRAMELAQKEGIPAYPLNVSNAFHSSFMKEASDKIQKTRILPGLFKSKSVKVYSCMSGAVVKGPVNLKDYFSKQVVSPVNFVGTVRAAAKECDLMIELGPGKVLTDLVRAITKEVVCLPVENTAGNDRDLNMVLAEVFVRNVPVKFEELYKNRLIKTFVPASRKKFIENQCERPFKIDNQALTNRFQPVLLQVKEEASEAEEIIPGGLPELAGKEKVADLLMALTHEITGFERDSISLNLRLLDDLNLDSIKAAELIGKAARMLGITGQVDPSQLSNNTLGQICGRLNELAAAAKTGSVKESVGDILKRYQGKTWVRNFVPDLRPEEIKTKNVNQLKSLKHVVFLSGKNEGALVKTLENEFKIIKARTQKIYFGDSKPKTEKSSRTDCLIAVLPKGLLSHELDKASLKSIFEHMHQMTDLAGSNPLDKDFFVVFVQFGGGAASIASTLFLERPDLKIRVIDFDDKTDDDKVSQRIFDELQTYEAFSSVVYDAQLTRRVVYYENSFPVEYKDRKISWSKKDVVLVTGGAKGITAQCALEFARFTKAQMVLMGRSPMPDNKNDGANEITQTLKLFEKEDLKAVYYRCDVSNEKEVAVAVGEIKKKMGDITGVIHGAGLNSLRRLKQTNIREVFQEALPKVMGAVNICNALKNHPPKLIAAMTSIIGLTGMEGSGWYGLSNEILNLYLKQFKNQHPQTGVVTMAYSIWDEIGMGAKLGSVNRLAEKGIGAIPVKEGIKHFRQLIEGDPGAQQVIVAARVAGLPTWKSADLRPNNFRFLEKIEYILPGIELIARANLNIEDDPYLLDHNWKGSLLFPFVFGFEAMAQAVAYTLGMDGLDRITARDINLERPISVPQESGTIIEIHAQVLEREKKEGPHKVKVEIYSQETGYQEPHFSAIFEIIPIVIPISRSVIPAKAGIQHVIDLDMETDIYGPILFQGELFQCIEEIHELYYDDKTKKGECLLSIGYGKSTGGFLKEQKKFNNHFLTGDPFFIDSILQSMQLIIPQDVSLPRDIEEIELVPAKEKANSKCLAQSAIKWLDADYYRGDAEVNQGKFLLRIKNCRLKVLDTILSNPSANDLSNPAKRDQKIIEDKLASLSKELGFIPPVIKCLYDERLKNAKKEERHKIELPLIREAVEELFQRDNKSPGDFKVNWLASGKPVIEGKDVEDVGVSVSHHDSFLIIIVSYGEQGCDVEKLQSRTNQEWVDLLGHKYVKVFASLNEYYDDKNLLGTGIWCLAESFLKCLESNEGDITIGERDDQSFSLFLEKDKLIYKGRVSFKRLTLGANVGVAYAQQVPLEKKYSENNIQAETLFKNIGYRPEAFQSRLEYSGPQNQLVFIKSYPITFRTNKLPSKRVYFTSYFDWMGEIREQSANPIMEYLAGKFQSGNWGIATYSTKLEVLGGLKASDILETHFWSEKIDSKIKGTYDLCIDWKRITPDQPKERVAFSRQRIIWVKIVSHGVAQVEELPNFIEVFMDTMKPRQNYKNPLEILPQKYDHLQKGEKIISFNGRINDKCLLDEEYIRTTLENSNLVGNVYFSNYAKWIGVLTDSYFYKLIPEYFKSIDKNGEFTCINCEINHLNEAMPFDEILVKMYINIVYKNALDLVFDFYLMRDNKIFKKLAFAKHEIIWTKIVEDQILSQELPEIITDHLLRFQKI